MASSNIRDVLTAFSPSLDFLALSAGDGRIKVWDTVKGQIQTEFADIAGNDETDSFIKPDRGHLSVDYTCMKWLAADRKKKRKLVSSMLVLGTGSGDILGLDVSAGQLKWRVSDCHPGGVNAISFNKSGQCLFTAGADGMICEIDFLTGNLLQKFRASTKAISSISISPDGKMVATAAGQLKIFNCQDHKKTQKFSGHPGAVRCMIFSEDGKYILSSSAGERYVAIWKVGSGKKQSASCVLAMEHPAVFLDCRSNVNGEPDNPGLYVLAISEIGVCYFWCGQNVEELRSAIPTKISLSKEENSAKNQSVASVIFSAKLHSIASSASGNIFVACGSLVKPLFQKISVHAGTDIVLKTANDGVLLPNRSLGRPKKGEDLENKIIALDRANAEGALLPIPRIFESRERKKTDSSLFIDANEVMADIIKSRTGAKPEENQETGPKLISMEDRLRTLGLLGEEDLTAKSKLSSAMLGIDLEANISPKKMRAAVLSMEPSEAYKLLEALVTTWQLRSCCAKAVLPWIKCILINHNHHIISQEKVNQTLCLLSKRLGHRGAALQPLLQLVGRLQIVIAQIDKAIPDEAKDAVHDDYIDESNDEDDEVADVYYGQDEDGSQLSSGSDDE